ncbi:hypothetical protein DRO66_06385, partial [Candidatus Bathyarchaeota archaeon]
MLLIDKEHFPQAPLQMEKVRDREGVLAVIKDAELGFFGKPNKNNRTYTKELWEKAVLEREEVMARIKQGSCFGQLGHPKSLQVVEERIASTLTSFRLDEKTGFIRGDIEILDTPAGRIVYTLGKANRPLGTSTRGAGEERVEEGISYIDEDSYQFGGVDHVASPSNDTFPALGESEKLFILEAVSDSSVMEKDGDFFKPILESLDIEVAPLVQTTKETGDSDNDLIEQLQGVVKRLRDRVLSLQDSIIEAEDRTDEAKKAHESENTLLKKRIGDLTTEVKNTYRKSNSGDSHLEESDKSVSDLTWERDSMKERVSYLEGLLGKKKEAILQLEQEKAVMLDLQETGEQQKETVQILQIENVSLKAQIACLENNVDFSALSSFVDDLSNRVKVEKAISVLSGNSQVSLPALDEDVSLELEEEEADEREMMMDA